MLAGSSCSCVSRVLDHQKDSSINFPASLPSRICGWAWNFHRLPWAVRLQQEISSLGLLLHTSSVGCQYAKISIGGFPPLQSLCHHCCDLLSWWICFWKGICSNCLAVVPVSSVDGGLVHKLNLCLIQLIDSMAHFDLLSRRVPDRCYSWGCTCCCCWCATSTYAFH